MIFEVPKVSLGVQKWVQNGVQNEISMLKALESLFEASWDALGALRGQKKFT